MKYTKIISITIETDKPRDGIIYELEDLKNQIVEFIAFNKRWKESTTVEVK